MKNKVLICLLLITNVIGAQNFHFEDFSKEKVSVLDIDRTNSYLIDDLVFNVVWDDKLSHSQNIGFYGGIKELTILRGNKVLQTLTNVKDKIALGNIIFNFYDYNFDGYLDFSIPIDCGGSCWYKYYIYNEKLNRFVHQKSWDYLRIHQIDKTSKLIKSQPDGNSQIDNRVIYCITNYELVKY